MEYAKLAQDADKVVNKPFIYRGMYFTQAQLKKVNAGGTVKLRAGGFSGWTLSKAYAFEILEDYQHEEFNKGMAKIVVKKAVDPKYVLVNVNVILRKHQLTGEYAHEQEILMFNKGPYLEVALADIIKK